MKKEIVNDVIWELKYVHDSVKSYGKNETFDIPFYVNHLKKAIELMESEIKDVE
jgi:hypothetical protein